MLFFFNLILIISSFFVFLSQNPIHSVLFLVLTFISSAIICFCFGSDFLGLIFIIIYVGAIAILFLFIVMMLDIKLKQNWNYNYIIFIFILSLVIFFQNYFILSNLFSNFNFFNFSFLYFDTLGKEIFLSQMLFNFFLVCFLLAGIILLISMVGAISLTLDFNNKQQQLNVNKKQTRSDSFLSFFN